MANWKVALAQHPMYLIIREDSQCVERTPPWGEPTIARYIERVRDTLATVRRYPQLKVGFEWSAVELEMLAHEGPDVFAEMLVLAKEGRVAFYNGTYAQPHLQILSAEANYRQFAYGLGSYRRLCGHVIHVYEHQESSVHDQVPQLLHAFGIEYATIPHFLSTLAWLDEGELLVRGNHELMFVHGHEFVAWQGLDGSTVNLYLTQPGIRGKMQDWWAQQDILGLLHAPPLVVQAPDLVTVDDAWLLSYEGVDFVLLDEELKERLEQQPPRARARLYTSWSYSEGIRAEELSRRNWQAERAALRAEALGALAFVLLGRPPASTETMWKTILTAQHHDVYCFSAPELRAKAIGWLHNAEKEAAQLAGQAAAAIIEQIETGTQDGAPVVVFNTMPHPSTEPVAIEVNLTAPVVEGPQGDQTPADVMPGRNGCSLLRFLAEVPGLGYVTYRVRSGGGSTIEESDTDKAVAFENAFYRALVRPDGVFESLALKETGDELVDPDSGGGNRLTATDSRKAQPQMRDLHQLHPSRPWRPAAPGPRLGWEATAPSRLRRSPLGLTLVAHGRIGEQVKADVEVTCYHHSPRIDIAFTLEFNDASIGTFYDDESKLCLRWALAFEGEIHHDIPFGIVKAWPERPVFPTSWIDVSDRRRGLAYFHQGTPKHWLRDRTLSNLLAWGEDTDAIGNRIGQNTWPKGFDQRLRGTHVIHCAVYPHAGDWQQADLVSAARSYGCPPWACAGVSSGKGTLPSAMNLLTFMDRNLSATAIMVEDSLLRCRVYSASGQPATVDADMHHLRSTALRSLTGEDLQRLAGFQIGHLFLEPAP